MGRWLALGNEKTAVSKSFLHRQNPHWQIFGNLGKGIEMKIAFIIFAAIAMMTSATAGINNEPSCDNPGYRMDQRCVGQ